MGDTYRTQTVQDWTHIWKTVTESIHENLAIKGSRFIDVQYENLNLISLDNQFDMLKKCDVTCWPFASNEIQGDKTPHEL